MFAAQKLYKKYANDPKKCYQDYSSYPLMGVFDTRTSKITLLPCIKNKVILLLDYDNGKYFAGWKAEGTDGVHRGSRISISNYRETPLIPRVVYVNNPHYALTSHEYSLFVMNEYKQKDHYCGFTILPSNNDLYINWTSRSLNGGVLHSEYRPYIFSKIHSWVFETSSIEKLNRMLLTWIGQREFAKAELLLSSRSDLTAHIVYSGSDNNIFHEALERKCSVDFFKSLSDYFSTRKKRLVSLLNKKNAQGHSVIDLACQNDKHLSTVYEWFLYPANNFTKDNIGNLLLHCVKQGAYQAALDIINKKPDPAIKQHSNNKNLFHFALDAKSINTDFIKKISLKFSKKKLAILLNHLDNRCMSPLDLAIAHKKYHLIQFWLENCIDSFSQDQLQHLLLKLESEKQYGLIFLILTKKSDLETPLMQLRRELRDDKPDLEKIEQLCKSHLLDPSKKEPPFDSPLQIALKKNHSNAFKVLLNSLPQEFNQDNHLTRDLLLNLITEAKTIKNIMQIIQVMESKEENSVISNLRTTTSKTIFSYSWKGSDISAQFAAIIFKAKEKVISLARKDSNTNKDEDVLNFLKQPVRRISFAAPAIEPIATEYLTICEKNNAQRKKSNFFHNG